MSGRRLRVWKYTGTPSPESWTWNVESYLDPDEWDGDTAATWATALADGIAALCGANRPVSDLPTLDGEPSTPHHGHVGYPVDEADVLRRQRSGLPAYWPTDPRSIDQRPYLAFAAERGANSK